MEKEKTLFTISLLISLALHAAILSSVRLPHRETVLGAEVEVISLKESRPVRTKRREMPRRVKRRKVKGKTVKRKVEKRRKVEGTKREEPKEIVEKTQERHGENATDTRTPKPRIAKRGERGTSDVELEKDRRAPKPQEGLKSYVELVVKRVERHKHYPYISRQRGEEGSVTVRFTVEGDGRVSSVKVEKPSGYPLLDKAAKRAIFESSPLPPTPDGRRREIKLTVNFNLVG